MKKIFQVKTALSLLVVFFMASCSQLPTESLISDGKVIGQLPKSAVAADYGCLGHIPEPTLTYFPAKKGRGAAVIICPGGGYGKVCYGKEGIAIARWLNTLGVEALVLKYRLPAEGYIHPTPLQDAQRAIRLARSSAGKYGIKPDRIGIMGFSAGGHLASTTGTHFDQGDETADDPVDRVSCTPDFMILVYPVITFEEPYAHMGSRNNLLGDRRDDEEMVKRLSNNLQVTRRTPPNFLAHAEDDMKVKVENSILFSRACGEAGVPSELKVYEKGGHGFSLGREGTDSKQWIKDCEDWLRRRGLIK
jgi:acetyl esterase/lipase